MTDTQTRICAMDEASQLRQQRAELFRQRATKLINDGYPDVVVAARLGCSASTVRGLRRSMGVRRQNGEWHNV